MKNVDIFIVEQTIFSVKNNIENSVSIFEGARIKRIISSRCFDLFLILTKHDFVRGCSHTHFVLRKLHILLRLETDSKFYGRHIVRLFLFVSILHSIVMLVVTTPQTLIQSWLNDVPASLTLAQHSTSVGSIYCV